MLRAFLRRAFGDTLSWSSCENSSVPDSNSQQHVRPLAAQLLFATSAASSIGAARIQQCYSVTDLTTAVERALSVVSSGGESTSGKRVVDILLLQRLSYLLAVQAARLAGEKLRWLTPGVATNTDDENSPDGGGASNGSKWGGLIISWKEGHNGGKAVRVDEFSFPPQLQEAD